MQQNRSSPRRLARDGDAIRIASKLANMRLHPLESKVLVEQAGVEGPVAFHLRAGEEAKDTELFIHIDCG